MKVLKAYLDWDELEKVEQLQPPYETYNYKTQAGKIIACRVLVRRKNGEIVVRNENGVDICLTAKDLF
jgi:hypothetical protein